MTVPFRIKAFGWRLFHDRLPTKNLLMLRGLTFSLDNINCPLCGSGLESSNHLFFGCWVSKKVWNEIAWWVAKGDPEEEESLSSFMEWHNFFHQNYVNERRSGIVWLATTWTLWILRNGVCFRKDNWSVNNTVWNIKELACRWSFHGKINYSNYSFYDFVKDPFRFLS
ncbi:uncharacterized protein LOC131638343 [Vicia villosa]|uniref:uncharacterized protein LOC131638343 n=1 Tax=Vicia villosa TaxID=3911 RepID=UPI00273CA820|nr:uncharacterized protein LOC131638343 [Vicia villosa]